MAKKLPVLIVLALYTLGYWVFRLPLLLVTPFVRFDPDSFQYANVAYRMSLGQWPDFGFLPPLYPMLLHVTELSGLSAWQLVQLQMMIGYLCGAALVHSVSRWSVWSAMAAVVALFWYQGAFRAIVYQDASVLTESVYTSSLMLLVALLIDAVRTGSKNHWLWFSIVLSVPVLLRPNGIVLMAWTVFLVGVMLLTSRKHLVKWAMAPAALVLALFVSYGAVVNGSAIPFRLKMLFTGRSSQDVNELERRVILWEGATYDQNIWNREAEMLADSTHIASTSPVHKLLMRMPEFITQPLSSGDLAHRGLVHGGVGEMTQLLPPFFDKDSTYWLSQSCYPIPPALVRYAVREYWEQGVPDFRQLRYRHEGTWRGALVNYLLRCSEMMHKVHSSVSSALPFFLMAGLSWGLLLLTGWRSNMTLHIALLLLAALFTLDALTVMAGAGRMLARYTFPPVFIPMVMAALSMGGLLRWWQQRRVQRSL